MTTLTKGLGGHSETSWIWRWGGEDRDHPHKRLGGHSETNRLGLEVEGQLCLQDQILSELQQ